MEDTFWNGEPCSAERVIITVADMPHFPGYWAKAYGLVGTEHPAVRIGYRNRTFFIDDEFGKGWRKVTEGRGEMQVPHAELEAEPGSVRTRDQGDD